MGKSANLVYRGTYLAAFDFLVEDALLAAACHLTEEGGYRSNENIPIIPNTVGEYEAIASFPGLLADFRANELRKVPLKLGDACVTV